MLISLFMKNIDKQILSLLEANARMPINAIAKHLRQNRDTISRNIKRMEDGKIITGYYPMLDLTKLGYQTHRLNLEVEEMNKKNETEFINFLDNGLDAGMIYIMDQKYNWGVYFWTKSAYEIEKLVHKIKDFLKERLLSYKYALICEIAQFPRDNILDNEEHKQSLKFKPTKEIDYDDIDIKILKSLSKNARKSSVEISKEINVPQTTVISRIRKLEKNKIILSYRTEINGNKFGFTYYGLEFFLKDRSELKEIQAFVSKDKRTTWMQSTLSDNDFDIEIEIKNRDDLDDFLLQMKEKFKTIRKILYYPEYYKKITYLPK